MKATHYRHKTTSNGIVFIHVTKEGEVYRFNPTPQIWEPADEEIKANFIALPSIPDSHPEVEDLHLDASTQVLGVDYHPDVKAPIIEVEDNVDWLLSIVKQEALDLLRKNPEAVFTSFKLNYETVDSIEVEL